MVELRERDGEGRIDALEEFGRELDRVAVEDARPAVAPKRRRRLLLAGLAAIVAIPVAGLAVAEISDDIDRNNDGVVNRSEAPLLDRNDDGLVTGGEVKQQLGDEQARRLMFRLARGDASRRSAALKQLRAADLRDAGPFQGFRAFVRPGAVDALQQRRAFERSGLLSARVRDRDKAHSAP